MITRKSFKSAKEYLKWTQQFDGPVTKYERNHLTLEDSKVFITEPVDEVNALEILNHAIGMNFIIDNDPVLPRISKQICIPDTR